MNKELVEEIDEDLLTKAKLKMSNKNPISIKDYRLSIRNFLAKIYLECNSGVYGDYFEFKLQKDTGRKLKKVPTVMDRADLHNNFKHYFEVKLSFLSKSKTHCITNIRNWQNINYFILCFVNDEFIPFFYCVPKNVVIKNMNLTHTGMNNTKKINLQNNFVATRTTFKHTDIDSLFKEKSVLNGTSYDDLKTFINSLL